VKLTWLRGHSGHDENERADRLAVGALAGPDLAIDEPYERGA
jgi:ribonuclease HI